MAADSHFWVYGSGALGGVSGLNATLRLETYSTATSATITGLTNGSTYEVQVQATNATGDSAWSASTLQKLANKPDAPDAPTLASKDQSLAVSWTAPADNGSAIIDYDVRYSSDSGANWTEWQASTTSTTASTTITGLTNGTTYAVQVRAANGNGEGPWSASATLKVGLPGPPLHLWALPKGGQFEVSWLRNLDDGATLVTDYDIRYRESGQSTWIDWKPNETSTERVHMVTGLTNGTTYEVQARAENVYGIGPWTETVSQDPGAPDTPYLNRPVVARTETSS